MSNTSGHPNTVTSVNSTNQSKLNHWTVDKNRWPYDEPLPNDFVSELDAATHPDATPGGQSTSDFDSAASRSYYEKIMQAARGIPLSLFEQIISVFSLDTPEGKSLLKIVEALPRTVNETQALQLIRENLNYGRWDHFFNTADSGAVDSLILALEIGKEFLGLPENIPGKSSLREWLKHKGEIALLIGIRKFVDKLGQQFVCGETLPDALRQSQPVIFENYTQSFDMLGESALTLADANFYFQQYLDAILFCAQHTGQSFKYPPSISIKLSALDPCYELRFWETLKVRLIPKTLMLFQMAIENNIQITIDAEESWRLDLSLKVLQHTLSLLKEKPTENLIGIAVQAYQRRASRVIYWLTELASTYQTRFHVRLVKGAYWDAEIKAAEQLGLNHYPVFTKKSETDENYLICASLLIRHAQYLSPQFATHNARSISQVLALIDSSLPGACEFQKLYGMGDSIYQAVSQLKPALMIRTYCPIGEHRQLLPYLVRRLLENGANTSFLNQFYKKALKTSDGPNTHNVSLLPDNPRHILQIKSPPPLHLHSTPLARDLFKRLTRQQDPAECKSIINGAHLDSRNQISAPSPGDLSFIVSVRNLASEEAIQSTLTALTHPCSWWQTDVKTRIKSITSLEQLIRRRAPDFLYLLVHEAGKCVTDACSEIRELLEFCNYYPIQFTKLIKFSSSLGQYNGEKNQHNLSPRGDFLCISPWNFPLAIMGGQIVAALLTGNRVVAKPSSHTPLIAQFFCELCYEAGIPHDALQFLLVDGKAADTLIQEYRFDGIAFTGSTEVAKKIQHQIATFHEGFPQLIAETGGINAMIVDTTALPEQVIIDAMAGAFNSAGQRCSATRLLLVPDDQMEFYWHKLVDSSRTLNLGHPAVADSHLGPLISASAKQTITNYIAGDFSERFEAPSTDLVGYYQAPTLLFHPKWYDMKEEVFGPVLHIASYASNDFEQQLHHINQLGFGLTASVHSRLSLHMNQARASLNVGNLYLNRNQIGAIPGCQPFGGIQRSGTGAKAGGPFYLMNFVVEKTISENMMAAGGNLDIFNQA